MSRVHLFEMLKCVDTSHVGSNMAAVVASREDVERKDPPSLLRSQVRLHSDLRKTKNVKRCEHKKRVEQVAAHRHEEQEAAYKRPHSKKLHVLFVLIKGSCFCVKYVRTGGLICISGASFFFSTC